MIKTIIKHLLKSKTKKSHHHGIDLDLDDMFESDNDDCGSDSCDSGDSD